MKEYKAQTGGRYCYNEDIINLQDLALAYSAIFEECGNFVVSGCKVVGDTITPGTVWLNGKLRQFNGATGVVRFPQYIYESNTTEAVEYANNTAQIGRELYECQLSSSAPTLPDPVTGRIPEYIMITEEGGADMQKVFFGRHCMLRDSESSQEINSAFVFMKEMTVNASLVLKNTNALQIYGLNTYMNILSEYSGTVIRSGVNGNVLDIKLGDDFTVSKNGNIIFLCNEDEFQITASSLSFGSLMFNGSNIYNPGTSARDSVSINVVSTNNAYFKNTYIGDGKGNVLLSVVGMENRVYIKGDLSVEGKMILPEQIEWDENLYIRRFSDASLEISNKAGKLIVSAKEYLYEATFFTPN